MTKLLVVIGGSDAGTAAALRAREVDADLDITMLVGDGYLNYSVCGLPFLISGEVARWPALAHRSESDIAARDIDVRLKHRVRALDVGRRTVTVDSPGGTTTLRFDRLVIGTGAHPVRPPIPGVDLDGVSVLHTMDDGIALREHIDRTGPSAALVLGAGYIGVEMADALARRGIRVTLIGRARSVLPTVHPSLGTLVQAELERNGVGVLTGTSIERLRRRGPGLVAEVSDGREVPAELVIVGAGVRPDADLAASAGIELGFAGAIRVDRALATSAPDVWAAGDCVETWHALLKRPVYLPLGTTSHKQGRVAGANAAGGTAAFGGIVGTQVVKVFELAAARTGLSHAEARAAGFAPRSVEVSVPDHKPYYPGAEDLRIRVTGDDATGRLLGAQIVGPWQASVAKRIDITAMAIQQRLGVGELDGLDLSYTPPLGAPWDPVQVASQSWEAAGRTPAITEAGKVEQGG